MLPKTHLLLSYFTSSLIFFISKNQSLHALANTNTAFDFSSLILRNFTLLGDSYLRNGVVGLTRDVTVPSSSSGSVIYNNPITFFDSLTNSTRSFSTKFTFCITNLNPASFGDGLVFFISSNNRTLGGVGAYLGLVNSTGESKDDRFVAVEFDTKVDSVFIDPDNDHVGLDLNNLVSVKTVEPGSVGIDLKSGKDITAWIDYVSDSRVLKVFLSYSDSKPNNSLMVVDVDLSSYLKEPMFLGFSGSTEGSTELHLIRNWSFKTFGLGNVSDGHNVSNNGSVAANTTKEPVIPVVNSSDNRHRRLALGLGITGPAFFCIVLSIFGYITVKKWQRIKEVKYLKAELVTGPREYGYKELSSATKGFHSSRIIGRGAFGNVYKAFFVSTGSVAAVKRSKHSHEGKTEFLAELSIIACLRHKNLVQLQGWCVEKGELLLVYDFMPHGSLDSLLYQESERSTFLTWSHRLNIAVGLASALTYLHQECEQQVIHRDIKTSNVMLDANFNAKLGDFGLARLMDHDRSPVSTLTAGTMGYLAPEYLQYGTATEKTDVFSYGVVILELACGRRPIDKETEGQNMLNLVDWVWKLHSEGRIIEAADNRLNGDFIEEEMRNLLLVGLSCANPNSAERPTMRRVLRILNGEGIPLHVPKKKPTLTFSCSLALSIEDIVSDCE